MKKSEFEPFEDEATVASFGNLSVENGRGQISVHGQLAIRTGAEGAAIARALADLFARIAEAAEARPNSEAPGALGGITRNPLVD